MTRAIPINDRIRAAVREIYAEHKAEGALPLTLLHTIWELHQRGIENKDPRSFEKRVERILCEEAPGNVAWETLEEIKARKPDPVTKMRECDFCGLDVAVPLDFKRPLGADFLCGRPECIVSRKAHEERIKKMHQLEDQGESPYGVSVSTIEADDPQSQAVKRIQAEWGVHKIKVERSKPKSPAPLPPIEIIPEKPQRVQHKLSLREVAALLDIKGFADPFSADEVQLYKDYASGNYTKTELEARVIGKTYPTIHLQNFWDNLIALENAIIIRGLALNRIKPRVQTGMDSEPTRGENEAAKRNGVKIGIDLEQHEKGQIVVEREFAEIEAKEVKKTERKFPARRS